MSVPVFHDVELQPGSLRTVGFRRTLIVRRPMLLLECPLNYRFRQVVVASVRWGGVEHLAVEHGVPAELFSELPPNDWGLVLQLPPLVAGDELELCFANPIGAPIAAFRAWFGELHELQTLRRPGRCPGSDPRHAWRVEPSRFSRANRCAYCEALWVGGPL
jgi:hypothetical protein